MKLYVIGIGPGSPSQITPQALHAMQESQVIVGYTVYVDLVRPLFPNKEYITTAMKREEDRCRMAVDRALQGSNVAVVCSGDSGVYGMAGLVLTMAQGTGLDVEIIPGMTAATTGAALLGAPLTHDFAVISLSDLLTPLATIEKRLECAAEADFVIVLYNPMSHKRRDYLQKACDIILKYRDPQTPAGFARNIGRDGEEGFVLPLGELRNAQVDMFTTVFIGNSHSRVIDGKLVTPRGYGVEGV